MQAPSATRSPDESAGQPAAREIARASRSNLAAALFWMPRERRADMHVFYAFCRLVDDDADDATLPADEKYSRLERWSAAIRSEQPGEHSCMPALRELIRRREIPVTLLDEIVAGVKMDVEPGRFADFEALRAYSHCVAGAVGLVSVRVFGCRNPRSFQYAETLGQALQLTNIIRDVGEDWRNGRRIYLPESDMREAGYTVEDLAAGIRNDAFQKLMQFETRRARTFFEEATKHVTREDRHALLPARLMASVYGRLLSKLEREKFPVFGPPLRLSPVERLMAIADTFTGKI